MSERNLANRPGAAPAASLAGMRFLRVEGFEASTLLADADREAYLRRFLTLFADDGQSRRGGIGRVTRVCNVQGETFALKTLILPDAEDGVDTPPRERRLHGPRSSHAI